MTELPALLPIDHVVDGIYISGWRATLYRDYLRQAGITNVLKLYEDIPYFPDDFNTLENAVEDGEFIPKEALKRGVDFVLEHVNAGRGVLVMCGAGISRSSTFVLASLVERGHDLRAAFELLREKHPAATPHPELWRSLIQHYDLSYGPQDVMNWMFEFNRPNNES